MKALYTLVALSISTLVHAQQAVPVYLQPSVDSPQIGQIENLALATPADWPSGASARSGWTPIRYRGIFEVFIDNNDLGKDVEPKPGSAYYLEPDVRSPRLATASEQDHVDVISVDTRFCKLRLQTSVIGYVQSSSRPDSQSARGNDRSAPDQAPPPNRVFAQRGSSASASASMTELVGRFERLGLIMRNRSGLDYKLSSNNGRALALLDLSQLPDRINLRDYHNKPVRVIGELKPNENGSTLILVVNSLKSAIE